MPNEELEQLIADNQEKAAQYQVMLHHLHRIKKSSASSAIGCINKLDLPDIATQALMDFVVEFDGLIGTLDDCINQNSYLINYATETLQQSMVEAGDLTPHQEPGQQPLQLEQVSVWTFFRAKIRRWF